MASQFGLFAGFLPKLSISIWQQKGLFFRRICSRRSRFLANWKRSVGNNSSWTEGRPKSRSNGVASWTKVWGRTSQMGEWCRSFGGKFEFQRRARRKSRSWWTNLSGCWTKGICWWGKSCIWLWWRRFTIMSRGSSWFSRSWDIWSRSKVKQVLYAVVPVHVVPLPTEFLLLNPPNLLISQEFLTVSKWAPGEESIDTKHTSKNLTLQKPPIHP